MYFVYIDESGDKNPNTTRTQPYVLTAVAFHETRWKKFETEINNCKRKLIQNIYKRTGVKLELADAEVHSHDVRNPQKRKQHKFLGNLNSDELLLIVNLFYDLMAAAKVTLFSIIIDKSKLLDYMDSQKVHKKAYEFLLERVENFLYHKHSKDKAIFIHDNTNKQLNRDIAMKHVYFQQYRTTSGVKLNHILETPFFVESYLSNGVQLADLCAYNIYRAFLEENSEYEFFNRIFSHFDGIKTSGIKGIKIFPDDHRWGNFMESLQIKKAFSTKEKA